ncbi:hypothetical protein ADN00_12970 [Ornatilinea apprima]|uniref:Cas10/Cmr2 second palm domain-containing protein n=1 Tax=Ornatilinea apprima TaxID=1134406 RepID=A0A0P6XIH4_9CHLR|nr:hypothetical protein [Ornatilinea apprima]KPL75297.1 hypothetical protein ADN00_12970 [Ornatilinea apprima]
MAKWLVSLDTDKIKQYIYSCDHLKEIRGASGLLDHLNRETTPKLIEHHHGSLIFVGGGSAMATFSAKDDAQKFADAVQKTYLEETGTATISSAIVEYQPDDSPSVTKKVQPTAFNLALREASVRLQQAKNSGRGHQVITSAPIFARCQRCGQFPIEKVIRIGNQDFKVCRVCFTKQTIPSSLYPGDRLKTSVFARQTLQDAGFPDLIEDLGDQSQPKNFVALVNADGNNIGKIIENYIHQEADLIALSSILTETIEYALIEAIKASMGTSASKIPIIPILIGGDDVMFLTPGHLGIPIAVALCQNFKHKFNQLVQEKTKDNPSLFQSNPPEAVMSAGVVIAKTSHPLFALDELSEELLKSAKQHSKELSSFGIISTIDFRVITTPTANPLKKVRQTEFRIAEDRFATSRPYAIDTLNDLARPSWEDVYQAILRLKKENFANNKIHSLQNILRNRSLLQAELDLMNFIAHITEKQHEIMKEINSSMHLNQCNLLFLTNPLNPAQLISPLPDLEEIYEFITEVHHDPD